MHDTSLWGYFFHAGWVVQSVMLILILASIAAWSLIFQRWRYLDRLKKAMQQFEKQFWSGIDLTALYQTGQKRGIFLGSAAIFHAGFSEFLQLRQQQGIDNPLLLENIKRALRSSSTRELEKLEKHMAFLASVGSSSTYIGLLGTVWGIMTAFHALGNVQQASISMVAPGISEALVATAMGLFAAIPAVLGYNYFVDKIARIEQQFSQFSEEFYSIMQRQLASDPHAR